MMRLITKCALISSLLMVSACAKKGTNPDDPYEAINRKTYAFNSKLDAAILKPSAIIYTTIVPARVRAGVNNAYNNVNLLPTIANDILQTEWNYVIKDTWRLIINSTIGIAGIFDPASTFGLPPHSNDLGITFAKWGDKHSPYYVIPFLGPSTFRDGMGMLFDCTLFTPYFYLESSAWTWGLLGLRYVDLRSQMFDAEKLMESAPDPYAFMRDAYLQHRNFLITGEQQETGELYIEEEEAAANNTILPETPQNSTPSQFPITTAHHATRRSVSA